MGLNSKDDFSVDDFLDNAFEVIQDKSICDPALIDPSMPGWQMVVNFDTYSPEIPGTQANEDLKLIYALPNFGYANFRYDSAAGTCTIFPLDDCIEDQFEEDILAILKRYRLVARVPDHAKRGNVGENLKKLFRYEFETIIVTFAPEEVGLKQIINRLTRLCAAQNLQISVDNDPTAVSVIISKTPGFSYPPRMDFEAAKLLDKLNADVF